MSGEYKNFTGLNPTDVEYFINLLGPRIHKRNTVFREAISVQDRLAVTLLYLATEDSTCSTYVSSVLGSLLHKYADRSSRLKENVKIPDNQEEWMKIRKEFIDLWNFPHAVGALDGKHVVIQSPFNSGTDFYN
ncbi:hypothetical protein PR048_012522 [Dryococelus australis]|uniref:Nuclease HARBI1 n=1 Tax=Dryococelus australis TaxID=614101 RepID=A0ABQ9HQF5_9NEOP|nr:hypothetical protein PR048_012522 [Dryococelus australis]